MIGRVLGNRYEIIELIGEGGMARVYKARCHLLNRFVAIKILRSEFLEDEEFIRKFKRESQAAASLSHPNIMNVYDVGVEEIDNKVIHYIVMEHIKGKTLKELIKEKGKLSFDETVNYSIQIAEALKHAHANLIVHRDIKPQNIIINQENMVKVTDFGIARAATSSTLTTTSSALGSVHYFSPEQARGGYTDEKSDIYSLGIVMYEMITGKLPYEGKTPITVALKHVQEEIIPPSQVDETVSPDLEAIILKCVQKHQSDRYGSIDFLLNDLRKIQNNDSPDLIVNNDVDIDEQPTRLIQSIDDELIDEYAEDEDKKSKNNTKTILSAVLLAFLVVSIVFAGWIKLKDFLSVNEVIVPNVVGMTESEARNTIEDLGLVFNVSGTATSEEFEPGLVISQSEKENTKVNEGFTIDVVISEGRDTVRVPGLINRTYEEAVELLRKAGLEVGEKKYEYSDVTPKDLVMGQEPEAFTHLEPGSKVNLIISQGEEIKKVTVPNLEGSEEIKARNDILGSDLEVGQVTKKHHPSVPAGLVYWQSHQPGSQVDSKTAIDLYVSLGPEEVEEPEPEPEPDPEPDLIKRNISLSLPSPEGKDTVTVTIFTDDTTVYNKKHDAGSTIIIELTGRPGDSFDVFYDDEYFDTFYIQ